MRSLEFLTNGFAQDNEGLSLSLPGRLLPCLNGGGIRGYQPSDECKASK